MNISDIFYVRHSDIDYSFNVMSHLGVMQSLLTVPKPGCTIGLVFFWSFSALFQHVDLVTTSLRAGFQVYLS